MTTMLTSDSWDIPLLTLAHEAWHTVVPAQFDRRADTALLKQAYRHCEALTSYHSRSFYLASALLKAEARRAVRALYAFCRTTDDIVDETVGDPDGALQLWRERALSWNPPAHDLVALAWADARAKNRIPQRYAEQLIEGVARDLYQTRYETFEELSTYCYGAASTVGLMSMHIVGYESGAKRKEAVRYAVKLGVALQLTNILRDVSEDWERGRLYLPQEELAAFGLDESDIARGIVTERWREFMKFQIARARRIYEQAWPGISILAPEGRLAIAAAATFYRQILDDIENHDYDVFSRRARVSKWGKLRRLPGIWLRTAVFN
jgi:phytoene synthase